MIFASLHLKYQATVSILGAEYSGYPSGDIKFLSEVECSDFEVKTSMAAEVFVMMKSRNESCTKNDGSSCLELAGLLHQMELKAKGEDKKELDKVLTKFGIKENSNFYFKKACKLKVKFACDEAKK